MEPFIKEHDTKAYIYWHIHFKGGGGSRFLPMTKNETHLISISLSI